MPQSEPRTMYRRRAGSAPLRSSLAATQLRRTPEYLLHLSSVFLATAPLCLLVRARRLAVRNLKRRPSVTTLQRAHKGSFLAGSAQRPTSLAPRSPASLCRPPSRQSSSDTDR